MARKKKKKLNTVYFKGDLNRKPNYNWLLEMTALNLKNKTRNVTKNRKKVLKSDIQFKKEVDKTLNWHVSDFKLY